jgi:hypothetical protein
VSDYRQRLQRWARDALAAGATTLAGVLDEMRGADPVTVLDTLSTLACEPSPLSRRATAIIAAARKAQPPALPDDHAPAVHPLDYFWPFDDAGIDMLIERLAGATSAGQTIGYLGAPTVFEVAVERLGDRHHVLIDARPYPDLGQRFARRDLLYEGVEDIRCDAVLSDPPWYSEHFDAFGRAARQLLVDGGRLLTTFPGPGTRPGVTQELASAVAAHAAANMQLHGQEHGLIGYRTPGFERTALAAAGIYAVPDVWRRGDLLTFDAAPSGTWPMSTSIEPRQHWVEATVRNVPLRVRTDAPRIPGALLQPLIAGHILPTVSRRDPRRDSAALWTASNRVYRSSDPPSVLRACRMLEDPQDNVDGSLRTLRDQIEAIVKLERAELRLPEADAVELDDAEALRAALSLRVGDDAWTDRLQRARRLHIAVVHEPYLELLLNGQKTVESRFSRRRIAPWEVAGTDDIVLLKRNAGPVVGVFAIESTNFIERPGDGWGSVRRVYETKLCATDTAFWHHRAESRYASLLGVGDVRPIPPLRLRKRDRRGWVTVNAPPSWR